MIIVATDIERIESTPHAVTDPGIRVAVVERDAGGDGEVERLQAQGLMSEIISWRLRLFSPDTGRTDGILATLLSERPIVRTIAPKT